MIVGGTLGVTYPDGTTLPAANVTTSLSPALTDTSNILTVTPAAILDGSNGIYANGKVYTSAIFAFNLTTATNVNLAAAATAAGWNGVDQVIATILSGNTIYATTTANAALTVNGTFPLGVKLINLGTISGRGGAGGQGTAGNWNTASSTIAAPVYAAGGNGGTGLLVSVATTVDNTSGIINGGGGGGGGGGSGWWSGGQGSGGGGGGGGSGGGTAGALGVGYPGTATQGQIGNAGTVSAGGAGGLGYSFSGAYVIVGGTGATGGAPGTIGNVGGTGGGSTGGSFGGTAGAAGVAVSGNANITWIGTGTRNVQVV